MNELENKNDPLVEDTVGPNAPNIETTDENLSVDAMFQQSALPSLGRQIFSVVPMHGPTGALFNLRKKSGTNDVELVRRDVVAYPSTSIKTGLTQEVIQDIRNQYGKEANNVVGRLLRGLANEDENTKTLAFLEANAAGKVDYPLDSSLADLQLTDSLNAETNLFEVTQRVHELVLRLNIKNTRTYEAFAVIPYLVLAGIMGLSKYAGGGDHGERGLQIAQLGQTKFYVNPSLSPSATSTTAYVGLKDSENPSKSSAVFSPYESAINAVDDYDSGNTFYHIFNRYAITLSPLSEATNEMIYKFNILT